MPEENEPYERSKQPLVKKTKNKFFLYIKRKESKKNSVGDAWYAAHFIESNMCVLQWINEHDVGEDVGEGKREWRIVIVWEDCERRNMEEPIYLFFCYQTSGTLACAIG